MESQNFEYAHMSPTTLTPNTNITSSTSDTLNGLNLSSTSESSMNSALQSPTTQLLLINTSHQQQPAVIDTTAGTATTLPPQSLPSEPTINDPSAQDLTAVLVNPEHILVMNVNPTTNTLDTTNPTQISLNPTVSVPSLIHTPTKVIDQVLTSQQEDQQPQLTITATPTTQVTQVVIPQEQAATSVIIDQSILDLNRISTIPTTSTSSLIDLNRQQVQQIDQATTVNNLTTAQAQAQAQAHYAQHEMQAIIQAMSVESQPQDQQQQHIILENDAATAAVQVQQAHHNAVFAQAAVAAAAEAQAHAHAQAQHVQAQVQAQVQAAQAAQAAAAVAVAQAHAQAQAQSQSDGEVQAQVQAQVQAAQTAQYVAAAAMAKAQVEAQIQTQVQAQVQALAADVVAAAQQVAHAAVVQVAAAEVQQAQVVQQVVMNATQSSSNSEQSSVVVMIDNPVTNSQSTPTTIQAVQAVVTNDSLQLVESLVTKAQLEEQNRQLCMGIVNNNPLTADVQVNSTIGPQPEPVLSVSKPPMADLLSSAIVPNVNPAWNIEPNNSTNMVVSTSIHLMNVADEHNNVVLDSDILNNNNTPQAQTLTFVNENPQLDMQSSQKSVEITNSTKIISEVSSQHEPHQNTNPLDSEMQTNEQKISEKSPQQNLGDLIDNQSNLNSSSQKDSSERDHNTSPESINVAAHENVGVIKGYDNNNDNNNNNLSRKNSTSNLSNSPLAQQIVNDEDLVKIEPPKSVESNWLSTSFEDMSMEQLLARLAQYEYSNLSRDQLISRIKYFEQNEKNPKSRSLDSKSHKRARSSNSRRSSLDSDVSIMIPEDEMEDVKRDSNRSETAVAGYSTQSSPSITSSNIKQEVEEDKKEVHKCMWRGCAKELFSLDSLISHVGDTHIGSGKATYSCDWEGCTRGQKPFTKRHKMYNHLRTHTGERPFVCTVNGCGKRFSRPDSLTTHVKTHSNHRPYICPYKGCNKAYYHSRSLRKHEKTHDIRTSHTLPPVHPSIIPISNNGMHISFAPPNRMYPASQPHPPPHQPHQPHQVFPQKPAGIDSTSSNSLPSDSRDIRSVPPPPQPIHPHHLPPVHQLHPSSPVGPASSNSAFSFSQHRLLPVQSTPNTLPPHGYPYPLQPLNNHRPELIHHSRASQAPLPSTSSPSAHFFTHTTNSFSQPPSSNVSSRSNNNNNNNISANNS